MQDWGSIDIRRLRITIQLLREAHEVKQDGIILSTGRRKNVKEEDWSESSWSLQREAGAGAHDSYDDIQVWQEKFQTCREEARGIEPLWYQEASKCEVPCILAGTVKNLKYSLVADILKATQ